MNKDIFYRIYVKGLSAGYDLSPNIDTLRIEESSGKADRLTVRVSDPYKVISHAVQEGMQVEVELGTVDDHSIVFRGMIYKTRGDFPENGTPTVTLVAYDQSMAMGLRKRHRFFTDMTLTEIIKKVAKEYFSERMIQIDLSGEPSFSGNGIRQRGITDLAFLLDIAKTYGCEMFATAEENDNALNFIAQNIIMNSKPNITLYHGRCGASQRLLNFQATTDVSQIQLPRVFSGIDEKTGDLTEIENSEIDKTVESEDTFRDENFALFMAQETERTTKIKDLAKSANKSQDALRKQLGEVEIQPTIGFVTPEDLKIRSQNQFSTSLHGMRANGATNGNHRIQAQTTIEIADVGGRFSNVWYLSQVRHILDKNGYRTEFECQR